MSRVAKRPIALPKGVEFNAGADALTVKGPKGTLSLARPAGVEFAIEDGNVQLSAANADHLAMAGTARAILANMVKGVSDGFERKLELVGVGYRASMQGTDLNLSLGFSHPVVFKTPEGISIETPSQTEILVKGADKQRVGEVAAKIRVRYSGEKIIMKETKKA
jgi:large subunit ribosomal protein L6